MPGKAERVAKRLDVRGDQPEILGDHRERAELPLARRGTSPRRGRKPVTVAGVQRSLRDRPEGGEAAEVVEAGQVDELEGPAQALDPPAVAVARSASQSKSGLPQCWPWGRACRVEPQRRARAGRALDGSGGRRCPRRRRSGRRRSTGSRARRRTLGAPSTRAGSAPGRRGRRPRFSQSPSPERVLASGTRSSSRFVTRASGSARKPLHAANADADAYGEPTSSGGPSGSTCHQLWPAASSQSTNAYALFAEPPVGKRGRVQHDPARSGKLHRQHRLHCLPFCQRESLGSMPLPPRSSRLRGSRSRTSGRRSTAAGYPAKSTVGDRVEVTADIFKDGHEVLRAVVRYRPRRRRANGWSIRSSRSGTITGPASSR